ncbi:MAG: 16S rRNA (adenine(1518)-N(6)/adenine(1519)-N(6))-dimethyltransferase RsmA [Candidatus Anstonellaceae archaeon]
MGRRLGQHFLEDERVLEFEAECADLKGKSVLEIGAGDGRLTSKLLAHGARHVIAVELDSKLAKRLKAKFKSKVQIHQRDFLDFDESVQVNVVIGNIPYYITSPILLKLSRMHFDRAILCIQKEVASRMVAKCGTREYGRLSVFCQLCFKIKVLAEVPAQAFRPAPKVDSCIVMLEKTGFAFDKIAEKVIAAIFSHKKKSLKNSIIDARKEIFGTSDKKYATAAAQTLKYLNRKVFTFSPSEILEIAEQLIRWHSSSSSLKMRIP